MRIISMHIDNYKTIENLQILFDRNYTAICGQNDSGKTNIIRAIRAVFREEESQMFFYDDRELVSAKDDSTKWVKDSEQQSIKISIDIEIHKVYDGALFQFIQKQLNYATGLDAIEIVVVLIFEQSKNDPNIIIKLDGNNYEGIDAEEILKKIRGSRCIIFHNSTQSPHRFRYRESISLLGGIYDEANAALSGLKETADKTLKKIKKGFKKEIEELLTRLQKKYTVSLSLPPIDITYMPYELTLGEGQVDIPLDNWGSGTQNRTMIMMAFLKAKRVRESEMSASKITPVIIVEEPECFLHPQAQAEFGRILQDLSSELSIQLIVTTHSPYMLSIKNENSRNILLDRKQTRNQIRETYIVNTDGANWMEPFKSVLGVESEEFAPWHDLFITKGDKILLVEGETDKEYFSMLKDLIHGDNKLSNDIEVVSYDGVGSLTSQILVKFIKSRCKKLFITFDLDAKSKTEKNMHSLGLTEKKDYYPVGLDSAGKRSIEGLLPQRVLQVVHSANTDIVLAATSGTSDEQKSSRQKLKRLLLKEFKKSCSPGEDFKLFYSLVKIVNKALA